MLDLASEKNINFLTMLNDAEISQKYKKVSQILHQSKIMDFDIPIFNYLGVYDADYTIKNLFQVSDDTKHTLEDQTQRGANCYVSDNKLIMFIDVVEDIHSNEGLENSKFDVVY